MMACKTLPDFIQHRNLQRIGIEKAKSLGKYKTRKQRGKESNAKFLSKYKKAVKLLNDGHKGSEVCIVCDINKYTASKIKKIINSRDFLNFLGDVYT